MYCLISRPSSFIFITFCITCIFLLLPVSVLILYYGLQQWLQRGSSSGAAMSHSDSFTYHIATMELIGAVGCILCCCATYRADSDIYLMGSILLSLIWYGETFFHILTSLERYLAVVHPITYLSLTKERRIRIRNISIGCVWLLCFIGTGLMSTYEIFHMINFCFFILASAVVSFIGVPILCILVRAAPGEHDTSRGRVDQSKQRAFYTVVTILGALALRFAWGLVWVVWYMSGKRIHCLIISSSAWLNLPSSLVLPLLFLYRTR